VRRLFVIALGAAALAAFPATASGRLVQAQTILPPGQSGFVSLTGLPSGTGSPHLTDQTQPFIDYKFKSALFEQPGEEATPRGGVRIVRDGFGVPAIHGASDYDAWWGVGYAAAQDRLFQLELFKRATSGRLAEILGPDFLEDDLVARRDFYTEDELRAMAARIPRNLYARAEAYRDGINAWIAEVRQDPNKLPGEFPALGVQLEDWRLDDTLRVGVFLARTIPSGDGLELDNAHALRAIGARAFNRLLPLRTPRRIATVPRSEGVFPSQPGRSRRRERRAFARSRRFMSGLALPSLEPEEQSSATAATRPIIPTGGSYMWAISRARFDRRGRVRRPGLAYLFNGPQLGYSIPELFFEFEIHSPVQRVRGVSAAGIPLIGIGHNGRVAWGFTSGLSDEDDLYVERLTGPETYRFRGSERQMDCRDETFTFRTPPTDLPDRIEDLIGGRPQPAAGSRTERVCRTLHGPVQARSRGTAWARRYATWQREMDTLVGLAELNEADSVQQAGRALNKVTWNENVIAIDDRGNIGYWHPGLHPLRPRGFDERLPYPGTGEAEWRGLLPRSRTPRAINPRRRFLFNWNNMPSLGWTNGDGESRERLAGPYHRSGWLRRLVTAATRRPSYVRSRNIDFPLSTTAQQRPLFGRRLRSARRGSRGRVRALLSELIRWDGSYHRSGQDGKVDPGVAIWEAFKSGAEQVAIGRLGRGGRLMSGASGTSHGYDVANGEAFAMRTLSPRGLRRAARLADAALTERFKTADISAWRDPRRMYEVSPMGAATPPELPFFDRGTWLQSVALGP
jgi:acyl-homoserine lactone acylase PvdQ